jgi:hypothetical protein
MELFRNSSEVEGPVVINGNVIHAYLCYNIIAVQVQLICSASLNKEMSGKSISVNDTAHCINKAILCSKSNDVDLVSEEVLNSLDKQIKISVDPIIYGFTVAVHFPM